MSKLLFICVCLKKCYETNKQLPQSLHLICHQVVQIQQKHLKFLFALLFLTYAKKVLYYSFTPWRKCVTVFSFLYVHKLFSNKKKSMILFVYCHENRNITISQHNTLPVFLLLPILLIHIQKLRYNSVYILVMVKVKASQSHTAYTKPSASTGGSNVRFRSFDFFFFSYLLSHCSL